jgi:hypothetical protein
LTTLFQLHSVGKDGVTMIMNDVMAVDNNLEGIVVACFDIISEFA